MITKAIVDSVISINEIRVRIPVINKIEGAPLATPADKLYIASINISSGNYPLFKKGDVVFVSFEDNIESKPIILGQLFITDSTTVSNSNLESLVVKTASVLPEDTTIGSTTAQDIINIQKTKGNLQAQIDELSIRIEKLEQ